MSEEDIAFLRDLADRLLYIPVSYEVDQGDADRLLNIASEAEERVK